MLCVANSSQLTMRGYEGSPEFSYLSLKVKKCSNNNSVRFYCISQIKTTKRWTDSSIQQRNVIAQHVVINEILSYYCDVNLIITSSNLQRDETKVQLYDNITQIA